jgi:hypothetical protein
MTDEREINAGYMTFKGDRTETFQMGKPYGPRGDRKLVWPVTIEYDKEKDTTRVGCSYQFPQSMLPDKEEE